MVLNFIQTVLQCIITDVRHDSNRAAMHSTVSAISMRYDVEFFLLMMAYNN